MTTQEAEAGAKAAPTVINATAELIRREQEARKTAEAAAAAIVAQYPDDADLIGACGKLLQVFAAACLKIRTKQGGPLWPFVLNWIQLDYLNGLRDLFTGGKGDFFRGIRDLIVKPRQLGFSTFIAALFFMDGFLEPGRISVIVTHDDKISQELLRTYRLFFDELPDQVKEGVSLSRASADTFELCFDGIPERSRFTIRTEKGTEWRGGTIHNLHCSEAAFYENWSRFFASYVQAVPASGNIIFETTCNGRNEFYEEVMLALEGANGYRVIFYAWFQHPEYLRPWDETTQKPLTDEERALMAKHGLDLEQIAWRRWKQGEVKDKFAQEYPETLLGAFLATGRPFFNLAAVDKGFEKAKAYWKAVEEGRISGPRYPRPYVTIYEDPIPGEIYLLPADIAEGIDKGPADGEKGGADFSYAPVIHVKTMRVVAIIHGRIPAVEFAEIYDRLGRLYQATVAPERNNHGHTVVAALQKSEYPELYHHAEYNEEGKRFLKPGWPTNTTTRRPMLDALAHVIEREGLFCPDLGFWREADRFIRNPKTGKPEAMQFWHDDRVIGLAIGAYLTTLGRNEWGLESTEGRDAVGFPRLPGTYKGKTAAHPGTDPAPEPPKPAKKAPKEAAPVDTAPPVQAWAAMRQAHAETTGETTLDRVLSPSPANLPGAPKALQSVGTTAGQSIVEAMQERNERRKRLCSMCAHCPKDPGTWCSHLQMRIDPYDPACGAFIDPEEDIEDATLESDFGEESWT